MNLFNLMCKQYISRHESIPLEQLQKYITTLQLPNCYIQLIALLRDSDIITYSYEEAFKYIFNIFKHFFNYTKEEIQWITFRTILLIIPINPQILYTEYHLLPKIDNNDIFIQAIIYQTKVDIALVYANLNIDCRKLVLECLNYPQEVQNYQI